MQILQWLLKIAEQEPPRIIAPNSTPITKKQCHHEEEKNMRKDLVILMSNDRGRRKHAPKSKVSCENLMLLRYFYQTLNLKGLGCFEGCRNPLRMNKKKKTSENKVLPLSQSSSRNDNNQLTADSDNNPKTTKKSKKKVNSRMKELLKWTATAKVLKGSKAAVDDHADESPKISFRLEMDNEMCAAGIGNWITTDSEFVVLEL
ncbi:uncharacterized protein LOC130995458 isoform X2 [Salvia miltiorrhiza]|uniref:uncharacterized protein LOC130995458 isoform X2 n=1 Tax=Salvia miltiorrhiza TaxID=226208 RepID=UPI0025AC53AF|nr:uncharacterized protein LOC130995458 isoform X2 [Salvia miltiorrhiza]